MPDLETVSTWQGRTMLDRDDHSIGPNQESTVSGCIAVTVVWGAALNLN
jgi:hypothetical protein